MVAHRLETVIDCDQVKLSRAGDWGRQRRRGCVDRSVPCTRQGAVRFLQCGCGGRWSQLDRPPAESHRARS